MERNATSDLKTFRVIVLILLIIIGTAFTANLVAQPAGYGFGKSITIQSSQVSGSTDLADYRLLINLTDPDLRTTANGGEVENANGYDIVFYQDDCLTPLTFQIERYVATNGRFVAWVVIPSLSPTTDQVIHMYYGNSAIATDQSDNTIWDDDYLGIYHFNGDVNDNTSNGNHGTNVGTTDLANTIIGRGRRFDGTSAYIQTPLSVQTEEEFTISAWVYTNAISKQMIVWEGINTQNGWGSSGNNNEQEMHLTLGTCCGATETDDVADAFLGNDDDENDTEVLNAQTPIAGTAVWQHVVGVWSDLSTTPRVDLYLNGTHMATDFGVADATTARNNWNTLMRFGRPGTSSRYFHGRIDEIRVSDTVFSADLIATEYNNQANPSAFYTTSAQSTAFDLCNTLSVQLLAFNAKVVDENVELYWSTASEMNSDYFTLQRSKDGMNWENIEMVKAIGNATQHNGYSEIDVNPYIGRSYYRLKETDLDGIFSYSQIAEVEMNRLKQAPFTVHPNPSSGIINFENLPADAQIIIYNANGNNVMSATKVLANGQIDISRLSNGIYYARVVGHDNVQGIKIIKN